MLFKYQGIDAKGKKIKAKIGANSLDEAKAKLRNKRIIYTQIKEEVFSFGNFSFKRKYKIKAQTLANISRDLSIYLQANLSIIQALGLIKEQYKTNKKLLAFFESLSAYLQEGKNFYTALEKQDYVILPQFYKQSIKISEDGGLLAQVLVELSNFLKEQSKLSKQMSSALAYPLFILFVSFGMLGFMLSFIVPKITQIFTQFDQALPASTQFVINLGNFFSANYAYIIFIIVAFILIFSFCLKRFDKFKFLLDKFLLKVPFLNSLIEASELSRFAYMNSLLIKSGVPIVQAFKLSANILKNTVYKKIFLEASKKVVEGQRLSKILDANKIHKIAPSFVHAIAIGEETSGLSDILSNLAILYNEANKDKITIFLALLEPILMLIVGSSIGFIVISMLLPIFSMNLH